MRACLIGCLLLIVAAPAWALGEGKLTGTGGLTTLDGAAGGGLVPWAVIAGHAERGQWDAQAALSYVDTGDFNLRAASVSAGWDNRLELSYTRLSLGLDALVQNGSFPNVRLETDVLAAKMRLGGDLIYGDTPQIAAGLQWRRASDGDLLAAAGAHATQGWDAYLAASRLWIDGLAGRRTLANLTLRSTSANQLGLLGFADRRSLTLEGSVAVFIDSQWALGAEYRAKPDRLAYALEDDWMDVFVAWLPSRRWHAALAYVDLGSVGGVARQHGYYFSVQASP